MAASAPPSTIIRREKVIDVLQQVTCFLKDALKRRLEVSPLTAVHVLEQHFPVADDVIKRRAQFVAKISLRHSFTSHDAPSSPT